MLILFLAFLVFCAAVAIAPKEVVQAGVMLGWVIAAAGCVASVASTALR